MEPSVNNLNSDQPKKLSKREDKKRVNLQWNHRLHFQIGLIVSLLTVFLVMESSLGYVIPKTAVAPDYMLEEPVNFKFEVEKPQPVKKLEKQPVKQKPAVKPASHQFEVKPNSTTKVETQTATTTITDEKPTVNKPITKPKETEITRTYATVEFVPVFPGCESLASNADRRACMSEHISNFVQRKFKTSKFENLLDSGKQKIYVQFKIDASGDVVDIAARGSHSLLEKEASRVIGLLPTMEPGKQGDKKVSVLYSLPIVFQLD